MNEEKLKPCPFCGSDEIEISANGVECQNCFANGPYKPGKNLFGLWNSRQPEQTYPFRIPDSPEERAKFPVMRVGDQIDSVIEAIVLFDRGGCAGNSKYEAVAPSDAESFLSGSSGFNIDYYDHAEPIPPTPEPAKRHWESVEEMPIEALNGWWRYRDNNLCGKFRISKLADVQVEVNGEWVPLARLPKEYVYTPTDPIRGEWLFAGVVE